MRNFIISAIIGVSSMGSLAGTLNVNFYCRDHMMTFNVAKLLADEVDLPSKEELVSLGCFYPPKPFSATYDETTPHALVLGVSPKGVIAVSGKSNRKVFTIIDVETK